ncbi:MAG: pyridoxal-dependent decarboxylase, partial [Balneolaceae bacterium]|nr:pyridoxal-dependent decarboxylase [Balneolaceae bacterium]
IGGTTPAALGADWLTSAFDQMAYAWISSPLAAKLEMISLEWLKDLFGIPGRWQGIMTTGSTMGNFVCLAAARQWAGERLGIDPSEEGLAGAPPIPVFSSRLIHASDLKALGMLGLGRASVTVQSDAVSGGFDTEALKHSLTELDGTPAIIIAVAGEPNAGEFDPIAELADLAEEYNAWLHVDGAFGLFAAVTAEKSHLVEGIERAHSVTVDGHKWLNVPYDTGFAFVHEPMLLTRSFTHSAEYLPEPDPDRPFFGALGPEMSRRARSLSTWATLRAYGRRGIRYMVEQCLEVAQHLSDLVDEAPDLERLAEVPLNVVCFRYNPGSVDDERLNELNDRLGKAILKEGEVFVGTTTYRGKVAFRPAIANWRTRNSDVELLAERVRELGADLSENRL